MTPPENPAELVGTITPMGLMVDLDLLIARLGGRKTLAAFLRKLTVVETPQPGRPKSFARKKRTGFRYVGRRLCLPRVKAPVLFGRVLGRLATEPMARPREVPPDRWWLKVPFYVYQEAAAEYVCRPLGPLGPGGGGSAYVEMGTGMGKSRFAMAVAARCAGPVFVVVPTKIIRVQWLEEFAEVFPHLRCGSYVNPPKNSKKIPPGPDTHDVVVGIVNTVRVKKPGFFQGYSLVVLDEAHEFHSPKNIQVLWLAQGAPRVLGLSATPGDRIDGLDRVVYHFLGKPIRAKDDIPDFDISDVSFRGRVREVEYKGDPDFCETMLTAAGTPCAIGTIGNIVGDPARLRLAAAEVERLLRLHETEPPESLREMGLGPRPEEDATEKHPEGEVRRHGVFVFAELRDYLPALRDAILERVPPQELFVPELGDAKRDPSDPVVLRGGSTEGDLGDARSARVVLTTYGYSRRGVSLTDMTAMLLATPRRNGLRQILGRITRRGSDESIIRTIVDLKDVRTSLKSQSTTRRKVYKEKEYPIARVKVKFEDCSPGVPYTAPGTSDEAFVWEPDAPGAEGDDEDAPVDPLRVFGD